MSFKTPLYYKDKNTGLPIAVLEIVTKENFLNVKTLQALKNGHFRYVWFASDCFLEWEKIDLREWYQWIDDNPPQIRQKK